MHSSAKTKRLNVNITSQLERYDKNINEWRMKQGSILQELKEQHRSEEYDTFKSKYDLYNAYYHKRREKIVTALSLLNELDLSKIYTGGEINDLVNKILNGDPSLNAIIAAQNDIKNDPTLLKDLAESEKAKCFLFLHKKQLSVPFIRVFMDECGDLNNDFFKSLKVMEEKENSVTFKEKFVKCWRAFLENKFSSEKAKLQEEISTLRKDLSQLTKDRDEIKSQKNSTNPVEKQAYWHRDDLVWKCHLNLQEKIRQLDKTFKNRFQTKLAILSLYQNNALSSDALSILLSVQLDKALEFLKKTTDLDPFAIDDELEVLQEQIATSTKKIAKLSEAKTSITSPSIVLSSPSTTFPSSLTGGISPPVSESPTLPKEQKFTLDDMRNILNKLNRKEASVNLLEQQKVTQIISNKREIELENAKLKNLQARYTKLQTLKDERSQQLKTRVDDTISTYFADTINYSSNELNNKTIIILKNQFEKALEIYNRRINHWSQDPKTKDIIINLTNHFKRYSLYVCSPLDIQHLFGSLKRGKVSQLFLGGDERAFGKALKAAVLEDVSLSRSPLAAKRR